MALIYHKAQLMAEIVYRSLSSKSDFLGVQNSHYKPPTTNSNICSQFLPNRGLPHSSYLPHCHPPEGIVSVPLSLDCLVPGCDKVLWGPIWCAVPLISRRTVTLNFSINDIDLSISSLSHPYEVNPSTILHSTPLPQ